MLPSNTLTQVCLLVTFLLSFSIQKSSAEVYTNPPPTIVKTNWQNGMNNSGCIVLDRDNNLVFKMIFTSAIQDLSSMPKMQIFYDFSWAGGSESGYTEPLGETTLTAVEENGNVFYKKEWFFTINYSTECQMYPFSAMDFSKYIALVTPEGNRGYVSYPYENYLENGEAFPGSLFISNYDSQANFSDPIWSADKRLCCGGTQPESIIEESDKDINSSEIFYSSNHSNPTNFTDYSVHSLEADPNPFFNEIRIKFNSTVARNIDFELKDISGKTIAYLQTEAEKGINSFYWTDLSDLTPGIYILQGKTSHQLFNKKLIKN